VIADQAGLPRLSINELCLPTTTFSEDVALARATGYSGLGIDLTKLDQGHDAELLETFQESGLTATVCTVGLYTILPVPDFGDDPSDPADRIRGISEGIRRLAPFKPATILCSTGEPEAFTRSQAWAIVEDGLKRLNDVAARYDTVLSLEPMLRRGGTPVVDALIPAVDAALELALRVGNPPMQIIVDVWHLFDSPDFLDAIERAAGQVSALQANDYRESRAWRNRAMPGEGFGDVPAIMGALDRGGFSGWVDLEVFSEELWTLPTEEFMRRGSQSILSCWAERY
jgi:sugar phosphate isomerase/epimerase